MNVLVMRFSALGDVAMLSPVVREYAQQHAEDSVTVLSVPFCAPLFEDIAPNVSFLGRDVKTQYRGIMGLYRLFKELHAMHFDRIVDVHDVLRTKVLRQFFRLRGYEVRVIDKHRSERRQLTAEPEKKVLRQLPTSFENYAEVFARLGYPVDVRRFHSIFPPEGGNLNLLPKEVGPKKSFEKWIGIAPFAAHQGKVYPPRLMEEVIQQLLQKYPKARIFLFGRGEQEDEYFKQWTMRYPQCLFVAQHCESMFQELILMSHLDTMLSMDSANMHLASLVGIPVVSVWGATHPMAGFLGFNQSEDNIIQLDLNCRPCSIFGNKPCRRGDYACLQNIPPERIVERITTLINN